MDLYEYTKSQLNFTMKKKLYFGFILEGDEKKIQIDGANWVCNVILKV